jgi:hypothetical protein
MIYLSSLLGERQHILYKCIYFIAAFGYILLLPSEPLVIETLLNHYKAKGTTEQTRQHCDNTLYWPNLRPGK